jgi:hypothetical protein
MRISEIRNSQYFQDLCQQLFAAEYSDFQVLDDSTGDKGCDGYVPSSGRMFAIYCPEKRPPPRAYYQRKIRSDLAKAVILRDEYRYRIDEWVFVTPSPLSEELHRYLTETAKQSGLGCGVGWSEKNLLPILLRHPELESRFLDLFSPDITKELRTGFADVAAKQEAVRMSLESLKPDQAPVDKEARAVWSHHKGDSNDTTTIESLSSPVRSERFSKVPRLSISMRRQIKSVSIRSEVASEVERVLGHEGYPKIMSLGGNLVDNPVWTNMPPNEQIRLTTSHRPETDRCPLFMALDLFLIRANDSAGTPLLLTNYDDRQAGWQAFLFPFRKRMDKESPIVRHSSNVRQLGELLRIPEDSVRVSNLGRQYLVSVKPHPGYSELYAYAFEFLSVEVVAPPAWLSKISSRAEHRRFHWFQLRELQGRAREWQVNADVIRAVTHFFAATKVKIPESVPKGFVH